MNGGSVSAVPVSGVHSVVPSVVGQVRRRLHDDPAEERSIALAGGVHGRRSCPGSGSSSVSQLFSPLSPSIGRGRLDAGDVTSAPAGAGPRPARRHPDRAAGEELDRHRDRRRLADSELGDRRGRRCCPGGPSRRRRRDRPGATSTSTSCDPVDVRVHAERVVEDVDVRRRPGSVVGHRELVDELFARLDDVSPAGSSAVFSRLTSS